VSRDHVRVVLVALILASAHAAAAQPSRAASSSFLHEAQLPAPDGAVDDFFGFSVSVSGNTAVVGAQQDDTAAGTNAGSAYVFVRSGTIWTLQQKLLASDAAAGDNFGWSVTIAGDRIVVGAVSDDTAGGANAGSAYVFVRTGTTWSEQQKLVASDGAADDGFGYVASISGDTVVVGAFSDDTAAGINAGSAYVYVLSGGTWTQQQKLTASDGASGDVFGVSVSASGDTAVVGALQADTAAGVDAGAAYVFVRSGTTWTQQQKLVASDAAASDQLGSSVTVSGDTAVAGARFDDAPGQENAGSAYVFVRSATTWTQQQKLMPSDGAAFDLFGWSVSVEGDTLVVSAPGNDTAGGDDAGSAYVFGRFGTFWTEHRSLMAPDGALEDQLGFSISLSGDTVVAGAVFDDTPGGSNAGSAHIFRGTVPVELETFTVE
jgi:hypothetical protein